MLRINSQNAAKRKQFRKQNGIKKSNKNYRKNNTEQEPKRSPNGAKMVPEIVLKTLKFNLCGSRAPLGTSGGALGYPRGAPDAKITSKWNQNNRKIL